MKSHDVIKTAIKQTGVKAVAGAMSLSPSLVYKWCEDKELFGSGAALNPLERTAQLIAITQDPRLAAWVCQAANGFFVQNPPPGRSGRDMLAATQRIVKEFSDLLEAMTESLDDDGRIDAQEAMRIRDAWEELKGLAEGFVCLAERGVKPSDTSGEAKEPKPSSRKKGRDGSPSRPRHADKLTVH